ncbi:uncharacterized protein TRIREDRAFT_109798 [Trichoderma reesei QM6a]|uniref:Predicted protein n=2 Tax=Hypocrea jecorina TaxID=51453 RepID=G0RQJ0_HYPJQ|nr:uncharacterized protein TRIREDRAFT_109798 [Trichoderma reesei QM6a]EGR46657.1 predicted protein [Trichoderma reesei QM6a]ETS00173.1 hypothetical protein M419DRAFT_84020 [Trichoderma reesei RUT C-30]
MSSTHLDQELREIQARELQAYAHLRRQLGLDPIPEQQQQQQDTSTTLPPPIPPRNPARGTHYAYIPKECHACNLSFTKNNTQKQKMPQQESSQQNPPQAVSKQPRPKLPT